MFVTTNFNPLINNSQLKLTHSFLIFTPYFNPLINNSQLKQPLRT